MNEICFPSPFIRLLFSSSLLHCYILFSVIWRSPRISPLILLNYMDPITWPPIQREAMVSTPLLSIGYIIYKYIYKHHQSPIPYSYIYILILVCYYISYSSPSSFFISLAIFCSNDTTFIAINVLLGLMAIVYCIQMKKIRQQYNRDRNRYDRHHSVIEL